jgi:hypothetical protein
MIVMIMVRQFGLIYRRNLNIDWLYIIMKFIGLFLLFLCGYGIYSTYRVLVYKELYRYYPSIRYRRKDGNYSKLLCYITGVGSIFVICFVLFIAIKCLSQ